MRESDMLKEGEEARLPSRMDSPAGGVAQGGWGERGREREERERRQEKKRELRGQERRWEGLRVTTGRRNPSVHLPPAREAALM